MKTPSLALALLLLTLPAGAAPSVDVAPEALTGVVRSGVARPVAVGLEIPIPVVSDDPSVHQSNPVIASDGESFLLVWRESEQADSFVESPRPGSLYSMRVNLQGRPLGDPSLISSSAAQSIPGLAFDGTNYLVVWSEMGLVTGVRVVAQWLSTDAVPLDAAPVNIRNANSPDLQLAAACGSDDCLAIFEDGYALLSKGGGVLRLANEFGGHRSAAIATPDGYAATTTRIRLEPYWNPGRGAFLQPVHSHAFAELPSSQAKLEGPLPLNFEDARDFERISSSLASNGSKTLVAAVGAQWRGARQELYLIPVPSRRSLIGFHANQLRIDVPPVDELPAMVLDPRVVWNGRKFLLVYQRSNAVVDYEMREPSKAEITGMWIEADGTPAGPAFDITTTVEIESQPALAAAENGLFALAFVRGRDASVKSRIFVRTLSDTVRTRRPARR